jgi:ketosteroid isomerase-like protein
MNKNLETIDRIYEAFGKGDISVIIDCLADDVHWEQWPDNYSQKAGIPWMRATEGKEGVTEFFSSLKELRINGFRVLSIMSNENQVAAEVMIDVDVVPTGKKFTDEEIHLWTFNDEGKIIRLRHYNDTAKHMAAAGKND